MLTPCYILILGRQIKQKLLAYVKSFLIQDAQVFFLFFGSKKK